MIVKNVWKGSPAEKSGICVRTMSSRPLTAAASVAPAACGQVLDQVWIASHPGDIVNLTIQRPGQAEPLLLTAGFPRGARQRRRSLARKGAMEVIGFYPMLFLVVGLAVLFLRVEDSNAWLLALMFAGFIAEPGMPDTVGVAPDVLMKFMYARRR